MKYLFYPAVLLIIPFCLLSCKEKTLTVREKPPVTVNVIIAGKVNLPLSIEVNGSSVSEEMVELYPESSGKLTYLNIPDGAPVGKGTLLAKINDDELQAQLQQQKVQLELAVKTEDRLKKLLEVNGVNQAEYDAALSQVNMINASINVLKAQIDKTEIRAPFNGNLGLRMVSPGAFVTPQTLLGTLQQKDKTKIDFTVPETYANLVEVGNTVFVQTNDSEEKQTAVISAVESGINSETRSIKVRARLKEGNIRPGSFVKVELVKNEQRIIVPSNCIIPNATSNQVITIKNNKPVFQNIETGIRNADAVEVVKGLNTGDSIVVSGVLFVRPNSSIKIGKVVSLDNSGTPDSKEIAK
jgi:membrane fusion protein (multidrug efflux system)